MRIVFATSEFVTEAYYSGGLANYVNRVSAELAKRGHQVHILITAEKNETFNHGNVTVHRVAVRKAPFFIRNSINYFVPKKYKNTIRLFYTSTSIYKILRKLNESEPIDIVQFPNCGILGSWTTFRNCPWRNILRASGYHALWDEVYGHSDSRLLYSLERKSLLNSDYIISPSDWLTRYLREHLKREVTVIRTPIFPEETKEDTFYAELFANIPFFIFVGRLEKHKGVEVLIKALPYFLEMCPDAHFVFAGIDSDSNYEHQAMELLGENYQRVYFLDSLRHRFLYPLLSASRAVVLPSLIDNCPNVMLEAMMHNKPVIGTYGASFEDFIDDEDNGFLVKIGDHEGLAKKMVHVWSHPLLERIGQNASKCMAQLMPHITVTALEDFYKSTLPD